MHDFIRVDDIFVFVYKKTRYRARLSTEGQLLSECALRGRRADRVESPDAESSTRAYNHPTNFALDAVDQYYDSAPTATTRPPSVNPSGWTRVWRERDRVSLNTLRDRLMTRYAKQSLTPTRSIGDVIESMQVALQRRKHTTTDCASTSADESSAPAGVDCDSAVALASRLLSSSRVTVAAIQCATKTRGDSLYRQAAYELETTVASLLRALDCYEQVVERLCHADSVPPAEAPHADVRALALRILAERRARVAKTSDGDSGADDADEKSADGATSRRKRRRYTPLAVGQLLLSTFPPNNP